MSILKYILSSWHDHIINKFTEKNPLLTHMTVRSKLKEPNGKRGHLAIKTKGNNWLSAQKGTHELSGQKGPIG